MIADFKPAWDIFCTVIDNYGDAAVCWRLARQLAVEHGQNVRLWCDHPEVVARLEPALDPAAPRQIHQGVELRRWEDWRAAEAVGDVVVEAFACELPAAYVEAMAQRQRQPVWINLEYLTAEAWADGCHLMPSPHPRLALQKTFFIPGFSSGSGGLLRERDLLARRAAFAARGEAAWQETGLPTPGEGEATILLFGYANSALSDWLERLQRMPQALRCLVPEGPNLRQIGELIGRPAFAAGDTWQHGNLTMMALGFRSQDQFDRLLWSCDVNFVRGEDSFVRAQWAARPLVWHIYPQSDEAHLAKLNAFLDIYCHELQTAAATACRNFWRAWNAGSAAGWEEFWQQRAALLEHAARWCTQLAGRDDLATALANFAKSRLK